MRREFIAAMLAGAVLVPTAALADITLYGKIYAELATETVGSGALEQEFTTLDDGQNLGRLGVKFSQDLRDGLQVFGKYEFSVNAPDSAHDFDMRDAHVGIRNKNVSVAMGRFDGAYKVTGGINWDPFAFTSLQLAGNGGQSNGNLGNAGFIDHAIQGQIEFSEGDTRFNAIIQYAADNSPAAVTTPQDSFLGGVTVGVGGFDIMFASSHNALIGTTNQKFGVKAVASDFTFLIQVENVDSGGYDAGGEGQFLTGIATYTMGNWLWVIEIGDYNTEYVDDLGTLPTADDIVDWNASLATFGGRYYLAKNAWVVFGVRATDSQVDALDSSATVVGLRYDF